MKTLIQLSETIRDHLIKQRAKSVTLGGSCKYRNDTLMCAVGCLIADDVYEPSLEGKMSDDPFILDALKRSGVSVDETSSQLFRAWQSYHDSFYASGDVLSTATYRYIDWVKSGSKPDSPTNFHDMILKELTV